MNNFNFKINNFDAIRLVAALQVAIVHGYHHFELVGGDWIIHILSFFPGVPIFFVVSGFLISASLEKGSSLSSYFQNRFLRIFPALWVCFIFSLLSVMALFSIEASLFEFLKWVISQISIGQFYNPDFMRDYGVGVLNGSLWTIPVEIQFYLLLPLIYTVFKKVKWNSIFVTICIIILAGISYKFNSFKVGNEALAVKIFGVTVIPYLYIFLLGVILQRNLSFIERCLAGRAYLWVAAYLAGVGVSSYIDLSSTGNNINPFQAALLSLAVVSIAYSNTSRFSYILRGNDISYGVYIYHMIFVNFIIQADCLSAELTLPVMMLLTVFSALISWKVVEKPSLRLKKSSLKNR